MNKGILKKLAFIAAALMIAVLPFAATACPSGDDDGNGNGDEVKAPLKVGIMVPETGVAASKGRPMAAGIRDAIKYINEELGGVDGHQIEPVVLDSQYNATNATTIINDFINRNVLLFATQSSFEMTAAMGIANEAGLPGLVVFSAPNITQPPQHIYAQFPDYGDDWVTFAEYYLENIWQGSGQPKMAIMRLNNSTGQGTEDAVNKKAAELGITIVAIEEHTSTTASEVASLTRIRALNPDVIYIGSTPPPTAVIIKDAVDLGMYPGITIASGKASYTSQMVALAGTANAEGVYGTFPTVNWGDNVPGMAKMTQYMQTYNSEFADNMDYITAWNEGLIIAEILRLAIQNTPGGADALTPQNVETYGFKRLNNYNVGGLQGPVSYTAGDNRLATTLKVYRVENGVIKPVTDWTETPLIDYGF